MMIPEFIRFYNYTADQVFLERARTFFSLLNAMYRIQAKEMLDAITTVSAGMAGKEASGIIESLNKQKLGASKIANEVRLLEQLRGK
jgi:hypothetical protein